MIIRITGVLCLLVLTGTSQGQDTYFFGERAPRGEGALMGIFYDLTQTQDGLSSGVNTGNYGKVLVHFVKNGWDEAELNHFYRASRPLFTTQIWIPTMPTLAAPRAFGVEKRAPRAVWVIHYKGVIVPPHDGTYRFVGYGDDVLVVAINQKIVLASCWAQLEFGTPPYEPAGCDCLKAGSWIDCKASEPMDLDVLCCDNGDASGVCADFLLIEQKNKSYDMTNGYPILPIFQLAPYDTPDSPSLHTGQYKVRFSKTPAVWKALQ